jgi:uncharacterized protein (DUF2164 family)
MARITLDKPTQEALARMLSRHLKGELDVEIGQFEALDLLEYLSETLGPHFYNQGLYDAQAIMKGRIDDVLEAVHGIEQPVTL